MLGIGLDIALQRGAVRSAFNPASLFGGSDQGAVFDFTDTSKLYQTTDTSTPVTTNGQSIGRVNDSSGRGNHATQSTAGARPTYQGYAQLDGIDDTLSMAAINFSASDKMTIMASIRQTTDGPAIIVNGGFGLPSSTLTVDSGDYTRGTLYGSTGPTQVDSTGPTLNAGAVVTGLYDIAGAIATDEVKMRLNGTQPAQTINGAGPAGTGNFSNAAVCYLGSNSGASFLTGRIYRVIIINRLLSGSDLTNAERWCGAPAGVVL